MLLFISALATWPGLVHGIVNGHDILNHVMWHTNFARQFWQGDLYPRWLSDFYGGFGSPVFFFYGPIPFYVGAFIFFLLSGVLQPVQQLALSAGFSFFISGVGVYYWLGHRFSRNGALAGAVFYIFMPYHLGIDFYLRFAYGELWAMAFLPYLLLFVDGVIEEKPHARVGLSLFYMLLIMTHLPTTLMASPLLLLYAIVGAGRALWVKVLLRLAGGLALGICLASVYFIPAMTLQHATHIHTMQSGTLYYGQNFLFDDTTGGDRLWGHLRLMAAMTIFTFCLLLPALAIGLWRIKAGSRVILFWMGAAFSALFMMLPISKPIWDLLPALQKVQFPWRFHIILCIAAVPLLIHAVQSLSSRGGGSVWAGRAFAALVLATLLVPHAFPFLANPNFKSLVSKNGFSAEQQRFLDHNYGSLEHVPIYAQQESIREALFALNRYGIEAGTGSVAILTWAPRKIVMEVNAQTDLTMWVKQFYFPGWTARTPDRDVAVSLFPMEQLGLLGLSIPRGQHTIAIGLAPNRPETIGWLASGLCFLGLAIHYLRAVWRKGKVTLAENAGGRTVELKGTGYGPQ